MLNEKSPETFVATDVDDLEVSLEDYMEHYAEHGYEWVEGKVIKVAPIGLRHEEIRDYLRDILKAYFILNPIGRVVGEPFMMRLKEFPKRRREPDLMVILKSNKNTLKETYMDGAADICIEIVSPATVSTDHGVKLNEYEKGGVKEYWIVDPIRNECRFYRLNEKKVYEPQAKNSVTYETPLLPGLIIDTPVLWQAVLPNMFEIVEIVKAMLNKEEAE